MEVCDARSIACVAFGARADSVRLLLCGYGHKPPSQIPRAFGTSCPQAFAAPTGRHYPYDCHDGRWGPLGPVQLAPRPGSGFAVRHNFSGAILLAPLLERDGLVFAPQ